MWKALYYVLDMGQTTKAKSRLMVQEIKNLLRKKSLYVTRNAVTSLNEAFVLFCESCIFKL
jgi:hypothetical protein